MSVNRASIEPQQSLNRTLILNVPYWERWNAKNDDTPAKGALKQEAKKRPTHVFRASLPSPASHSRPHLLQGVHSGIVTEYSAQANTGRQARLVHYLDDSNDASTAAGTQFTRFTSTTVQQYKTTVQILAQPPHDS